MSRLATRSPCEILPTQMAVRSPPPGRPARQVLMQEADTRTSLLFVDSYNHTRSVLAHAHAERLRLRTLNAGRPNPFSRLDSAGLHLQSSLVTGEQPDGAPDQVGLNALFGSRISMEEQDVKRRLSAHRPRGITAEDFTTHDYILTFDQVGLARLTELHQLVVEEAKLSDESPPTAKIMLLGAGVKSPRPRSVLKGSRLAVSDYACTIDGIRTEMEGFMARELGWTPPPLHGVATPFRSRQFVARGRRRPNKAMLKLIEHAYECQVSMEWTAAGKTECVVTVTAKAAELRKAVEALRGKFGEVA